MLDGLGDDRAGGEALIVALQARRDVLRAPLVTALESARYRALTAYYRRVLSELRLDGELVDLEAVAKRELKRLRRDREAAGADPDDDTLHALRIRAKRARYAADLAGLVPDSRYRRVAKAAKLIQTLIGEHHDAVVAEQELRGLHAPGAGLALGRIVEHERGRCRAARAALPDAWAALDKAAKRL